MTILVLINSAMGLYKFRKELLQELISQGNEVLFSCPYDDYVTKLENLGCKYIESRVDRRGTNPFKDFKLLCFYLKIIRRSDPDIALTFTVKPNVYGGLACRILRIPFLPNITGLGTAVENDGIVQKLILFMYKIGFKNAKCIFFQNEPNKQFFSNKGIVKNNSVIVPGSGVNIEEYSYEEYPEDKEVIRLIFIGRIMKAKGVDELLEAAEQMKQNKINIEFHIVGSCEDDYFERLKGLDDSGVIHYHGHQDDVHQFIKKSHATILPSYHEGTSNVLLETAATGRPILASNVTGCRETFDDGISGFGFEARNVIDLVRVINNFYNIPYDRKKRIGIAGRKKMELEYDRKIVIDTYLKQINGR